MYAQLDFPERCVCELKFVKYLLIPQRAFETICSQSAQLTVASCTASL